LALAALRLWFLALMTATQQKKMALWVKEKAKICVLRPRESRSIKILFVPSPTKIMLQEETTIKELIELPKKTKNTVKALSGREKF